MQPLSDSEYYTCVTLSSTEYNLLLYFFLNIMVKYYCKGTTNSKLEELAVEPF